MVLSWILAAATVSAGRASPCPPTDLGDHDRADRPVALIVQTPGVAAGGYATWADVLERRGLDAWLVGCPLPHHDADTIAAEAVPEAAASFGERPVALLGHGLGGTLAAISVAGGHARPAALGLIGAPLRSDTTALEDWLSHRPLPDAPASPDAGLVWRGAEVTPLLLGSPLPPLEPMSPSWLSTLRAWAHGALRVPLLEVEVPVFAIASGMDNLAPPERVRPMVPEGSFRRHGYLSFDGPDPEHADLLLEDSAIKELTRWLSEVLR